MSQTGRVPINDTSGMRTLAARYQILNLVPESTESFTQEEQQALPRNGIQLSNNWKQVGDILGCCDVRLERIIWPGGHIGGPCGGPRGKIKVVTAVAAPFVMTSDVAREAGRDSCLRGVPCQMVSDYNGTRYTYKVSCCYGLSMDLLEAVAQELDLDFSLYMVPDTMFGSRIVEPDTGAVRWTGVVGDLIDGHADMAFTALSVSRPRSEVIDFSSPYYFSGVSFLAAPNQQTDIPLLAFLLPFSTELWIAIFTSLNVTAVAVAIYEWLSPFGLNPWGRQRTKNFSMSSALWVCWGLLCGHLVAFKAPKSWPNKFLINVWGGFSVIFVASYTANIAALIAGLFFHSATATYHDNSLLWQRVGTPKGSASEYYVHRANQMLWEHMQRFFVPDVATGVQYLKNGTLDILIADTPILDYYRATDPGCKLQKIGDTINEDTYAIGMTKGFPLKDSVSSVIAKFTSNGYMDILQEKWYGGLACFSMDMDMSQPKPLGVTAVAGVFMLLGLGFVVGLVILIVEHLFYRYTLPILRHKPKGTIWRSRNIMFFSQKLYRFINCVELVSPHHAARELVHTIRQGQITSLFQKSVKRKEHEQRRRRKSKAQFFEMIQEIRRVQQEEKVNSLSMSDIDGASGGSPKRGSQTMARNAQQIYGTVDRAKRIPSRLELARRFSKDVFRSKSSSNLEAQKFSSDINFAASRFFEAHSSQAIGRRLSRDTNLSPPDINSRRASHLVLTPELSVASSDGIEVAPKSPYLSLPHQRTLPSNYNHHSSFSSGSSPLGKQLSLQEHTLASATSRSTDDRLAVNHHHLPVSKQSSLGERSSSGSDSHHRPPPHGRQLPPHLPPHHPGSMAAQHFVPKQSSLQERSSAGMSHSMPKQSSLQEQPPEINVHPPPTPRRVTSLSGAPLGLPPPHPPKRAVDNQKFSYVDTTSPSFRERISKYAEEANNTISMSAEERRRHAPSLLEQISSMQEQFPTKPKVVSVKPKVPPRDGIPALRQVQSADGDPNLASGRSSSTMKRSNKDKSS
ncbi:Bacterial extracellular solute-Hypothetical protein proteins, family 3 [Nesidiocoris tenuis]|uniref:Ionotropic glutamate receptor C-terminal domain-containing protein n=1 Tax=Nesidiocoris tenuis TaxID=355587 RepID=A0ABN7BB85_9HEMI|nr:Bacterial extracellular solute-Hypothetical protein proteins, family 3 [Nesidiocoris tenuis]